MTAPNHPKRVVILDADNPLVEVQGEFFWLEDHKALVAAARDEAYRSGYQAGWCEALHRLPQTITLRRRRSCLGRVATLALWLLLAAYLVATALVLGERLIDHL